MAESLAEQPTQTAFDKGVARFTWLMLRFILVMVPLVFIINGLTKGQWHDAFFFALAVAVGLTPEMLPMIVTVCLSKGAMAMAKKKVIVKRINAIQNLGAMDVLCTDKTGTLTLDRVILDSHCDVVLKEDDGVLALAYLNSYFQTGLRNVMDRAVLAHPEDTRPRAHSRARQGGRDSVRLSAAHHVGRGADTRGERPDHQQGRPRGNLPPLRTVRTGRPTLPMEHVRIDELRREYEQHSRHGFRVLAIASKDVEPKNAAYGRDDENGLILNGYLAFLDPPKETAAPAIQALQQHGISVKVVTGDNDLVAGKICADVGLSTEHTLLGVDIDGDDGRRTRRRGPAHDALRPSLARTQTTHHSGSADARAHRRLHG